MSKSKSNSWLSSVLNNLSGFWSNSPNDASQTPFSRISESSNSSKLKTELPLDTFRSTSSKFSHDSSSEEREFEPVIDCDIAPPSSGWDKIVKSESVRYLNPSLLRSSSLNEGSRQNERKRKYDTVSQNAGSERVFNDKNDSLIDSLLSKNVAKRSRFSEKCFPETIFATKQPDIIALNSSRISNRLSVSTVDYSSMRQVPAPKSSSSSLSNRTKAILEQLEKISTPVKEVRKMPIVRSTERWASDVINSPVQKPPRHSLCALSRAQMISDSLTVPGSPYWRRPFKSNRQENLEERMLDLDNSKHPIVKRIPGTRTIDIGDTINISFDNNIGAIPAVESCENDAGRPIPEKSEGIPEVRKNIFSTKLIDLDVDVDHVDECTSNGNQIDQSTRNSSLNGVAPAGFLNDIFTFAPPVQRGPSFVKKAMEIGNESKNAVSYEEKAVNASIENAFESFEKNSNVSTTIRKENTEQSNAAIPNDEKDCNISKPNFDINKDKSGTEKTENSYKEKEIVAVNVSTEEKSESGEKINITENSDNKKGTWYCNECFISNASEAVRCAACNSDRTGKKSIKTLPNILANREFKPSAQINSGFSFGFQSSKGPVEDNLVVSSPFTTTTASNVTNGDVSSNQNISSNPVTTETTPCFNLKPAVSCPMFGIKDTKPNIIPVFGNSEKPTDSLSVESTNKIFTTHEVSQAEMTSGIFNFGNTVNTTNFSTNNQAGEKSASVIFGCDQSTGKVSSTVFGSKQESDNSALATQAPSIIGSSLFGINQSKKIVPAFGSEIPFSAADQSSLLGSFKSSGEKINSLVNAVQSTVTSVSNPSFSFFGSAPSTSTASSFIDSAASVLPSISQSVVKPDATVSNVSSTDKIGSSLFGNPQATSNKNLFSFGANNSDPSKGQSFIFGSKSNETNSQNNNSFSFGQPITNISNSFTNAASAVSSENSPMQVNSTPVEMVSPDGSSKSFNLGVTDAQQQSQFFTFGQVPTTSATLTGSLFGEQQAVNSSFPFANTMPSKVFSAPSLIPEQPSAFSFGASSANGSSGFAFGSPSQPPVFNFGGSNNTDAFQFRAAAPSANTLPSTNFFNVGPTSSTGSRKILRARRVRK